MVNLARSVSSPGKFIIAEGVLNNINEYIQCFGKSAFILADPFIQEHLNTHTLSAMQQDNIAHFSEVFNGECTDTEIKRLVQLSQEKALPELVIVGVGGGKTMDTAKALAHQLSCPVIIVPTIASTDAPCTALSVIYKDDGEFDRYLFLPKNPDAVLVDTGILVKAPAKFFAAGVGDALATYFEARTCYAADGLNLINKRPSATGLGIAQLCFDTLLDNIHSAMLAVQEQVVTPAFEAVIEATVYMSGVGAEAGGLAAAHAVNNGMSALPYLHHVQHGEKVVFGLLTQLILEKTSDDEMALVIDIIEAAKLPMCLSDFGVEKWIDEDWMAVAELACAEGDTMGNMTQKLTPRDVYNAMKTANALGQALRA